MAKDNVTDWSETAADNTDVGGVNIAEGCAPSGINNAIRTAMAQIAEMEGDDTIASATTTDLGSVPGRAVTVSGTTTITGFGTIKAGTLKFVTFSSALTLTHNGTSLILLGGANRLTAAGDTGIYVSEGSGNWRELAYAQTAPAPVAFRTASPTTGLVTFSDLPTSVLAWRLEIIGARPASDNDNISIRASVSGTAVTTGYQSYANRADYTSASAVNQNSTGSFIIGGTVGNASNEGYSANITIHNLGQAAYTHIMGRADLITPDGAVRGVDCGGALLNTTAYTEIQILFGSSFAAGEIRLYPVA